MAADPRGGSEASVLPADACWIASAMLPLALGGFTANGATLGRDLMPWRCEGSCLRMRLAGGLCTSLNGGTINLGGGCGGLIVVAFAGTSGAITARPRGLALLSIGVLGVPAIITSTSIGDSYGGGGGPGGAGGHSFPPFQTCLKTGGAGESGSAGSAAGEADANPWIWDEGAGPENAARSGATAAYSQRDSPSPDRPTGSRGWRRG